MQYEFLQSLFTVLGSGGLAWLAVRTEIKWIVKTLERHENYHNTHFSFYRKDNNVEIIKRA